MALIVSSRCRHGNYAADCAGRPLPKHDRSPGHRHLNEPAELRPLADATGDAERRRPRRRHRRAYSGCHGDVPGQSRIVRERRNDHCEPRGRDGPCSTRSTHGEFESLGGGSRLPGVADGPEYFRQYDAGLPGCASCPSRGYSPAALAGRRRRGPARRRFRKAATPSMPPAGILPSPCGGPAPWTSR